MMRHRLLRVLLAGVASAALTGAAHADSLTFAVDGEAAWGDALECGGDPDAIGEGDLVAVGGIWLQLGAPGPYRFATTPDGRLFLQGEGGRRAVGASIRRTLRDDKWVEIDGLAACTDAERAGLWGVRIEGWPAGIGPRLAALDPARTALTIDDDSDDRALPPIPPAVQYLAITANSSASFVHRTTLGACTALRALVIDNLGGGPLDLAVIVGNPSLRAIRAHFQDVSAVAALARLTALQTLDLTYVEEVADLGFATSLPTLRRLIVPGTSVTDLSPLARHPALAHLDIARTSVSDLAPLRGCMGLRVLEAGGVPVADLAPLASLPLLSRVVAVGSRIAALPAEGFQALRHLDLLSTPVAGDQVAAFRARRPTCEVLHGWGEVLRRALGASTRVRVRSGGTCHREIESEGTLADERDAAAVATLLAAIAVDEARSDVHCMCCGEPTLEFFRGDALVASIGFHHGQLLRWDDGPWPGDGVLTRDAALGIVRWLAGRGIEIREAAEAGFYQPGDLRPAPGAVRLAGVVVDGAQRPLGGALVEFQHRAYAWRATSDAEGRFTLEAPPDLPGELVVSHHAIQGETRQQMRPRAAIADLRLSCQGAAAGAIRVVIDVPAGQQIPGVLVLLCPAGEGRSLGRNLPGRAWVAGQLPPGVWGLHVLPLHEAWCPTARRVEVVAGETVACAISLEPAKPLVGTVCGADGAPLVDADVTATIAWPPDQAIPWSGAPEAEIQGPPIAGGGMVTMGRGSIEFTGESAGGGRLRVRLGADGLAIGVSTPADGSFRLDGLPGPAGLRVEHERATLFDQVVAPGGAPLRVGAALPSLVVEPGAPEPATRLWFVALYRPGADVPIVAAEARAPRVPLRGVPGGEYLAVVHAWTPIPVCGLARVHVGEAAAPEVVRIETRPLGRVRLRPVAAEDQALLKGAGVIFRWAGDPLPPLSPGPGRSIAGLDVPFPAEVDLVLEVFAGARRAKIPLRLSPGEERDLGDIPLPLR